LALELSDELENLNSMEPIRLHVHHADPDFLDPLSIEQEVWYFAYYIPPLAKTDSLSSYIINFKLGKPHYVEKWIELALSKLADLEINFNYIVRALGSGEIEAQEATPLDKLGEAIKGKLGGSYLPKLLIKTKGTKPLHTLGRHDRIAELKDVYSLNNNITIEDGKNILILDDIYTTGTTTKSIKKAIQKKYPKSRFYILAIGKTERDNQLANKSYETSHFR
jgi:predicted amidophosphoribosyltransferase